MTKKAYRPRLLVVDDDPAAGRALERLLGRHGYVVRRAHNRAEAVEGSARYDAAVLDIDLPDGDGIGLGEELLRSARVRTLVFHTANTDARAAVEARRLGRFVLKTSPVAELLAAIDQALRSAGH